MDLSLWETQYNVIYKHHVEAGRYPADAMLAITTAKQWTDRTTGKLKESWPTWRFPLDQPMKAGRKAAWLDSKEMSAYFRISPVHQDYPEEYVNAKGELKKGLYTRGPARDSLGVPCLFADLDTVDGVHKPFAGGRKGLRHPNTEEVIKMLDELLPPSLLVKSGGGLHAYWALDHIIDVPLNSAGTPDRQSAPARLLRNFDTWLVMEAEKRGFGMDMGLAADLTRILRVAGSRNWKRKDDPRPVTILRVDESRRYGRGTLFHKIPEAPAGSVRRAATAKAVGPSPLRPSSLHVPGSQPAGFKPADWKAVDRFSAKVPVSVLMREVWGMETDDPEDSPQKEWYYPRADGTVSHEMKSAVSYVLASGTEVAYAHSTRLHEEWGVDDFHVPLSSWNLLNVCFDDDSAFCRTLISGRKEATPEFLAMLVSANSLRHTEAAKKAA